VSDVFLPRELQLNHTSREFPRSSPCHPECLEHGEGRRYRDVVYVVLMDRPSTGYVAMPMAMPMAMPGAAGLTA